jgi:DNA-binding beta-propeller fold protein YncE
VFSEPRDLAVGPVGEIYVADTWNHCVRVVADGFVSTFAGSCGESGLSGDRGPADEALFNAPYGVAVDVEGNVYVSDSMNNLIRRIAR